LVSFNADSNRQESSARQPQATAGAITASPTNKASKRHRLCIDDPDKGKAGGAGTRKPMRPS